MNVTLALFTHLVGRKEEAIDLGEAALLIASTAHPSLDVSAYVRRLDELAEGAREELPAADGPKIRAVARWLYEREGFRGNVEDYYDPRNSYLDEVLDRRVGIPITLAVVLVEVCRRLEIPAAGVAFPGHFLVRGDLPGGLVVVDPFTGKLLNVKEIEALHVRGTGKPPPSELGPALAPATKRQILARMLTNLRGIFEKREEPKELRSVLELLQVVAPSPEVAAKIQALGGDLPGLRRGSSAAN